MKYSQLFTSHEDKIKCGLVRMDPEHSSLLDGVAIRNPERHVRKASHRGSKQQ